MIFYFLFWDNRKDLQVETREKECLVEMLSCERLSSWDVVYDAARATQAKTRSHKTPTDEWKRKMMLSPHSPIRCLNYFIQMRIPYFVSVHLVRHHEGVQWFIGSQRNDRQDKYDRRSARQDVPVLCTFTINADALRFISRRRLCNQASSETRTVWKAVVEAVGKIDPIVAEFCKPECWWCGGKCPELRPCGLCEPFFKKD